MSRSFFSFAVTMVLTCGACEGTIDPGRTTIVYIEPDASHEATRDGAAVDANAPEDAPTRDVAVSLEATADGPGEDASTRDVTTEATIDAPAPDAPAEAEAEAEAEVGAEPASCDDNVKDNGETDVDCGGPCPPCALGQGCLDDVDCSTTAAGCDGALGGCRCDAFTDTCVADHCSDQRKDDGETDVDCGGGQCPGCGPNKGCATTSDCSTTASGCDASYGGCACDPVAGTCVYNHCFDQQKDASETDVDCGGGDCPKCAPTQGCLLDFDCTTNACDGISAVCVNNQCIDHRVDGKETDVDCGGANICSRCIVGRKCVVNSDCQVGHTCSGSPSVCI
jgi:hypothetical protein